MSVGSGGRRGAACGLLGSVALFVAATGVAIGRYPGGNWFDRQHPGHDFWRNFLCDLQHEQALSGLPNPGSSWGVAGMLGLVAGVALMFMAQPSLFPHASRLRWPARGLGLVATLGLVAIPLMPSSRFGIWHSIVVMTTAAPALVATVLGVVEVSRASQSRAVQGLGVALLSCAVIDIGLFSHSQFLGGSLLWQTTALQKVATALTLVWMLVVAARLWRSEPELSSR